MGKGSGTILSLGEVEKRIYKRHGDKIKMSGYTFVSQHAHFTCSVCYHEWDVKPIQVYQDSGCPRCSNRVKYTREEIVFKIESKGGKLLTKGNVNTYEKMSIKYPCGHIKDTLFNDFLRHGCMCEAGKKRGKLKSKEMDERIISEFSKTSFKLLSINRKPRSLKVEFLCDKGHLVNQLYGHFSKTFSCKKCNIIKSLGKRGRKRKLSWEGRTELKRMIRVNYLDEWKKESIKNCDYNWF